jgi:hypothetical protein
MYWARVSCAYVLYAQLKPNKGDTLLGQAPYPRHPKCLPPLDLRVDGHDLLRHLQLLKNPPEKLISPLTSAMGRNF